MKEVVVHAGGRTEIVEAAIPKAGPGQIVVKVEVAGTNPKDFKTEWVPESKLPINIGDDMAGTVHEIGKGVFAFHVGDRVFGLHKIQSPGGSYAPYAIAEASTASILPDNVTFEEAATTPLASLTAAMSLYRTLRLPQPWIRAEPDTLTPLLIYGGSSAVGAFGIKLAVWSDIHPIITVAGSGRDYVASLLDPSKGDSVIDYRGVMPADLLGKVRNALSTATQQTGISLISFPHVFDAISNPASAYLCAHLLSPMAGRLAHVLPYPSPLPAPIPSGASAVLTMIGDLHNVYGKKPGAEGFGTVMTRAFARGFTIGKFSGHPYKVREGGLSAVQGILDTLKAGNYSAVKFLFRPGEGERDT